MIPAFPFTEKKFRALSGVGCHKWFIKWLTSVYHGLSTNRIPGSALDLFARQYSRALSWLDLPAPDFPDSHEVRPWMEFVSDAIHHHRIRTGHLPKDHDLLPVIITGDKEKQSLPPVPFNYHVALDGLRSLFNVGSIFRTCDAAGIQNLILGNIPDGRHPVIEKTSMGASAWMSHHTTQDLAEDLLIMKKKGFSIIGIETTKNSTSHTRYPWPPKAIIVLGNEEYGISSHVMRVCDDFVHIPMLGRKNSINVANAASVIVFQVATFFLDT